MKINVVFLRRLEPDEVLAKIRIYELKYGNIENLGQRIGKGMATLNEALKYLEWRRLLHAYKAYEEGEELDYVLEEIKEKDIGSLKKILTKERLKILIVLGREEFESISSLACYLNRNIKNVYQDLTVLQKNGFIRLLRKGRNVTPRLLIDQITLKFR
ncbi:MAG: HVO_A0114 family putative DNA-binding protein [Candidatus Baldrarchaeia archaeon]